MTESFFGGVLKPKHVAFKLHNDKIQNIVVADGLYSVL